MKEYWIFKNEPHSKIFSVMAESKHDALKEYNRENETNYKIVSEYNALGKEKILVVLKSAWLNYDFRKVSNAVLQM